MLVGFSPLDDDSFPVRESYMQEHPALFAQIAFPRLQGKENWLSSALPESVDLWLILLLYNEFVVQAEIFHPFAHFAPIFDWFDGMAEECLARMERADVHEGAPALRILSQLLFAPILR